MRQAQCKIALSLQFFTLPHLSHYYNIVAAIAKENRTHKVLKYRFSHLLLQIFLKYPHIFQKIRLEYEKIYYFKTASHLPANKFLMDFATASRSKVWLYKSRSWRKILKFIVARLISSALFGYNNLHAPRLCEHRLVCVWLSADDFCSKSSYPLKALRTKNSDPGLWNTGNSPIYLNS